MVKRYASARRAGVISTLLALLASNWGIAPTAFAQAEPGDDLVSRFLSNPIVVERFADHQIAVIRLVVGSPDLKETELGEGPIATLVLFDHTTGQAIRFIIDVSTAEPLREQTLTGYPQSSPAEIEQAVGIIRADPEHAALLDAGGVLDGGFIVTAPAGAPAAGRLIQLLLLTSDRVRTQRIVTVDLTAGVIFSSTDPSIIITSTNPFELTIP